MTENAGRGTLLDELDRRQNDVIEQLDELNTRIEKLLRDWSQGLDA
ncbi:MAG: hypothetical protein KDA60_17145 [Planctomycetales bacterium]|nr:hypothetical protein [Planctomycetales bacterium]